MNQLMTKNIIPPRTPIAVVRLDTLEHVVPMTRALARGGITRVEMTLTSERALEAVSQVQRELQGEVVIGMGTVLDGEGARASLDAGAAFLVTPIVAPEVIAVGHSHNVPVLCGAFTPTEIVAAWRAEADFIKVFPAGRLGPAYLKDILAPLPDLLLVPTGGVTLENCRAFLEAGAYTVGVGGQLVNTELIARQDWSALTTRARQFAQACVP